MHTTNNQRILIFTGGNLGSWALDEIRQGDYIIGADHGAVYLLNHNISPDLSVGDFDSVTPLELENIRHHSKAIDSCDAVDKDLSDTEMAFKQALDRNPQEIVILGALGTRFDHSLANVHLLREGLKSGITCRIVDEYNEIRVIDQPAFIQKSRYIYVSLLPLSLEVTGITLHGFQYPLHEATLHLGQSLAISNILVSDTGKIDIQSGLLLVIQSID
ncbi:MAG TPA: thiamine diphosphokinase [Bacilli bacterium]